MTASPDRLRTMPDPADRATATSEGQVLAWPGSRSESRAPSALLSAATAFIEAQGGGEGYYPTPMDGVHVLRSDRDVDANHSLYRPSLCIVLQGSKQMLYGDSMLEYGTMECLLVSMEIPACGRIVGTGPGRPFVGLTIDVDVMTMRDVLGHLTPPTVAPPPSCTVPSGPGLFVARVDEPLADCLLRLLRMTSTPQAIPVLFPSVMREIYYWLLTGSHGDALSRQVMPDTHVDRIANAILLLRENFAQTVRVEQLAEAARMSASSFHQHFKTLTSMTPLQFQKQLRLLEARRLMVADAASVTEAAYRVGYESASQFSREYARAFGVAPKRDAMNLKAVLS